MKMSAAGQHLPPVFLRAPRELENVHYEKKMLPSGYRLQTVVTTVADLMTFSLSRPR